MLYLIGLGLSDEKDVTVRGLEAIKKSERVYLEAYTSILGVGKERLEAFYEKDIIVADRDMVETESDAILERASEVDVSFLVVGDPFGATTHSDLLLRAEALSIPYVVIHNASVMNAVGAVGLALYNYGQTISIPYFTESWRPDSWLDRIRENLSLDLHTLCLLDIKVKEQSIENLARSVFWKIRVSEFGGVPRADDGVVSDGNTLIDRGRKIYEPPRFMSVPTAIEQLLSLLPPSLPSNDKDTAPATASDPSMTDDRSPLTPIPSPFLDPSQTLCISLSRIGDPSQTFVSGTLEELSHLDEDAFGGPLHSLVIVGKRFHALERDFTRRWAVNKESWDRVAKEVYGVRD
ncbi:BZ3500_MvSof-1268-A1-R1_Chr1-2g01416 [Microbotryum saponariae]|uniref:diphthine methyl ester synthase n=1 Tax=Microbotryum saponariae TaxID=289078 RepID=A0A2X0KEK3_9BASI|nr:BZ3500_MvSof-1268-A1-R1_Chr1-2g01416 [Microbotryum saponariae]SCZ97371.1 BZ3501_MvSof-1269-A2-R1_Chr1-2g01015 [Microbotryum saponariae]